MARSYAPNALRLTTEANRAPLGACRRFTAVGVPVERRVSPLVPKRAACCKSACVGTHDGVWFNHRNTQPGANNMDANALIAAKAAISTLERIGLMTPRAAKAARKELRAKISEAIAYWGDKGQNDIVEGLNAAYRAILP